ncbi:hypothetical protein APUTEX25_003681 [Auxenochlorella protothecoides]|uniref:HTH myb-type domain-containing protein n=1 Tax=Auxenochlorella protothecoides TaxID=3075 RepID=A0A3M7KPR5_AUXPR|nr:hypothetical protein APUTEX25_003681 [Auxenochlorella protothecoides]|eukprot:RMZ52538.1 hypothetical protein APUTEX25_003681 [Auxenochlorella protothecoides]
MSGDSPGTSRVSLGDLTEYDTLILPTGDSPSPARSEPPPPPLTSQDVSAAAAATMLAFAEMPYSATGQSLHEAGTAGTLAGVKRPNPEPDSGAGAWTPRSPTAPAPDPGGPAAASSAGGLPSGAGGTGLGSAALEHSGTAGSVESGEQGGRKARLVWTQELHNRFINALSHLGLKQAVPKNILTMMNVDGMTRENVASHLQKYRLYLKKIGGFTDRERVDSAALQRIHEQNVAQMAAQQAMQQSLAAGGGMRYGGPSGLPPAAAYGYGGHVGGAADPGPHVARADAVTIQSRHAGPIGHVQSGRRSAGRAGSRMATPVAAATVAAPRSALNLSPTIIRQEVLHSASAQQLDCVASLAPVFESQILPLLTPVDEMWQPTDFLPASNSEAFFDQIGDLRARSAAIPDDLLVCLVGDMITEEALPTYMAMLNTLDVVRDETGHSQHPYAKWTRCAPRPQGHENRHGDLLNKYMWLTGRVDMLAVERTIQRLISSGMDPGTENHPYHAFVFTSFQERATKLSHGSTARLAVAAGDEALAKICGTIARDESRHEAAYTRTMDAIFQRDPSGAMVAFAHMMMRKITMPAHLMDDGQHGARNGGRNLFDDFAAVAERAGVYTAGDYIGILRHLIRRWDVEGKTGLTPEGRAAQELLCSLPARFEKLAQRKAKKAEAAPPAAVEFSWIFNRPVYA